MLDEKQKTKLFELVKEELKDNADLFDTEAEIDSSLSYSENENILLDKIELFKDNAQADKSALLEQEKEKFETNSTKYGFDIIKLFLKPKIIGIIANANEGKSNMIYWIIETLKENYQFKICSYGLRNSIEFINPVHSLAEIEQIKNSIIIIDEMESLFDFNNRKIRKDIENTIRLIYHNNNVLLLCGLGENFKKFISAKLNVVIFKKISFSDLINGSRVKNIIMDYYGMEKGTSILDLRIDEALIFDGLHYNKIEIPYLKHYDLKLKNVPIIVPNKVVNKKGD